MKKIGFFSLLILTAVGLLLVPVESGFAVTDGEGKRLLFIPGDGEVTIGWRHSVEKTPWRETYRAGEGGELSLAYTEYRMYGAGTPDREGKAELKPDGTIRVTGIERTIPYYSLFYVPISQYFIEVGETDYPLGKFVPDYEEVHISFDRVQLYEWILMRMPHF